MRSLNQIITYDAYHIAEVYLTQPLQVVAGSKPECILVTIYGGKAEN